MCRWTWRSGILMFPGVLLCPLHGISCSGTVIFLRFLLCPSHVQGCAIADETAICFLMCHALPKRRLYMYCLKLKNAKEESNVLTVKAARYPIVRVFLVSCWSAGSPGRHISRTSTRWQLSNSASLGAPGRMATRRLWALRYLQQRCTHVGSEILTALPMKPSVFRDITPCKQLKITCYLLRASFLFGFFDPEDGVGMVLRNVVWL